MSKKNNRHIQLLRPDMDPPPVPPKDVINNSKDIDLKETIHVYGSASLNSSIKKPIIRRTIPASILSQLSQVTDQQTLKNNRLRTQLAETQKAVKRLYTGVKRVTTALEQILLEFQTVNTECEYEYDDS
jgi:hypothetical protein